MSAGMISTLNETELKVFIDLSLGYFATVTGIAAMAGEPRIEFARPVFGDFTGVVTLGGIADGCIYLTLSEAFLEELLNQEAKIDQAARQKIESQKRTILEGSQEWDILYRKYYNEEVKKLGV